MSLVQTPQPKSSQLQFEHFIFFSSYLFLLFFRPQALVYPPYWDSLLGPFWEGIWLLQNKFDFLKLALHEVGYEAGGPRVYFFSLYPSFQMIILNLLKNVRIYFFLNHLFSLAFAAGSVTLFSRLLNKYFGTRIPKWSFALLLFHPLFLSQAYAVNMEMPILFFGLTAVFYFVEGKMNKAFIFSLIASSIKSIAIVISATLSMVFFFAFFKKKKDIGTLSILSLPCGLFLVQQQIQNMIFNQPEDTVISRHLPTLKHYLFEGYRDMVLLKAPDIYLLMTIGCILGVSFLMAHLIRIFLKCSSDRPASFVVRIELIRDYFLDNNFLLISLIMSSFFIFFPIYAILFLPRYLLLALPFILFIWIWLAAQWNRKAVNFLILFLGSFYLLNIKGFGYDVFIKSMPFLWENKTVQSKLNSGDYFERTLEYEDDMTANLALIRVLEEKYRDKTIIAPRPIAQMLLDSRFGYVKEPFLVVSSRKPAFKPPFYRLSTIGRYEKVDGSDKRFISQAIWVYTNNIFSQKNMFNSDTDQLLERIKKGRKEILVFQKPDEENQKIFSDLSYAQS